MYRVREAFKELEKEHGILARQNFACCSSCASYEMSVLHRQAKEKPIGFVYYHAQDADDLKSGSSCYLGFGAFSDDDDKNQSFPHDAASVAIGEKVVEILTKHGLKTEWDGTSGQRILMIVEPQ